MTNGYICEPLDIDLHNYNNKLEKNEDINNIFEEKINRYENNFHLSCNVSPLISGEFFHYYYILYIIIILLYISLLYSIQSISNC